MSQKIALQEHGLPLPVSYGEKCAGELYNRNTAYYDYWVIVAYVTENCSAGARITITGELRWEMCRRTVQQEHSILWLLSHSSICHRKLPCRSQIYYADCFRVEYGRNNCPITAKYKKIIESELHMSPNCVAGAKYTIIIESGCTCVRELSCRR